eukprot:TRINITY_DN19500_c0_g1_i1.p1 TRINITY_DN19500_c0_g1~~TRINITY_DN19500_c0_g1_i1.p1  ORF type:complete len:452 (+),score=114.22 TRINITY_DN19500_c0_g1_i1:128-1357(+)
MASIEEREKLWQQHIQSQNKEYEAFDRNLSDKKSVPSTATSGKGGYASVDVAKTGTSGTEKKEKKDKKEKKEKKEKKVDREAAAEAAPPRITFLGGSGPPAATPAAIVVAGGPSSATAAADMAADAAERDEMPANFIQPLQGPLVAASKRAADSAALQTEARVVTRSSNFTWPDIVLSARSILVKGGRLSCDEFRKRWEEELGFAIEFPFFNIEDFSALIRELQPAALAIVDKKAQILQGSSDAALDKERKSWSNLQERDRVGTSFDWIMNGLEKELKLVRKSAAERRRAQQDANSQADKIRQEYQALQVAAKGQKTPQLRGTKADLEKQEQRANKFRLEAEDFERQEADFVSRIARETSINADTAVTPTATTASVIARQPPEPKPSTAMVAEPAREREQSPAEEDDFM